MCEDDPERTWHRERLEGRGDARAEGDARCGDDARRKGLDRQWGFDGKRLYHLSSPTTHDHHPQPASLDRLPDRVLPDTEISKAESVNPMLMIPP